ncbi:fibronectin type III domain-containing protein [Streptomyces sp. V3I7]|uniref:fibronectin type III domain-containing protein n=1 Tax=Streptomyces sp. V3I7 TaxID=3042278 RepID=UPI0027857341|nr:fibronectin type III domain-containing protein [Streptomyces sp. V3I7]MDQ0992475.1 outer membrane protein assembly factor BamB [Streptomyces sp. V3I7]
MRLRNHTTRVVTTASTAALLAAASLVTAATSAASGQKTTGKTLTADPLSTWQTDGIVWSVEYARGVVYVGGTFGSVRPPGARPGEREVARRNFAAFDASTGELLPCAHSFTGIGDTVRALKASPDGKKLYVGGSFSKVDDSGAYSAAALNTSDCSLRKDFRPGASATVRAIETTGDTVYMGGDFTLIDNKTRNRIAAFKPNGALRPFKADLDRGVRDILAATDHGKVLVGGDFRHVNGKEERSLIALDPKTGEPVTSFPDWIPPRSAVKTLARDGDKFYLGAEGTGTGIFDGRIAGRLSDGSMIWKDTCQGATQAVLVYKGILYSGSHAHYCGVTPGGFPEGRRRHFLAQSADDMHILHWFPDTDDGLGEGNGPRSLVMADGILWAGGEFTMVNGKPQQSLTRFGAGPDVGAPEGAPRLTVADTRDGRVTLTWHAAWDRDDAELTYMLYRDGELVDKQKQRSAEWDRPDMKYTDTVAPGSRHRYTISVTDGKNTAPLSKPLEVTAVAAKRELGDLGEIPALGALGALGELRQW